jgi:excisionase family DNA binding protein
MREVCVLLNSSSTTIRRRIREGKLYPVRSSERGHLLFPVEQVETFLKELK